MSEMGIKQIGYPTFDMTGQGATGKQTSRAPDDLVGQYSRVIQKENVGKGDVQKQDDTDLSNDVLQVFKEEFDLINNVELKFNKDDETGQTYIKIVDKESGDIIREIPPEEVRKLAEKLDEMVGILFDKKV